MATCPRCNRRAAKRFCPALDVQICAVCCARDRMLEIRCPETCQYLISGRDSAVARERELRTREAERHSNPLPSLSRREVQLVQIVEWAIVRAQREAYHNIADSDILTSVQNALKNLQTQDAGIIYEHREFSVVVDDISRRIRDSFEELGKEMPAETRPRRSEITNALEFVLGTIQSHAGRSEPRSYIRYAAQFFPWSEKEKDRIIVPAS